MRCFHWGKSSLRKTQGLSAAVGVFGVLCRCMDLGEGTAMPPTPLPISFRHLAASCGLQWQALACKSSAVEHSGTAPSSGPGPPLRLATDCRDQIQYLESKLLEALARYGIASAATGTTQQGPETPQSPVQEGTGTAQEVAGMAQEAPGTAQQSAGSSTGGGGGAGEPGADGAPVEGGSDAPGEGGSGVPVEGGSGAPAEGGSGAATGGGSGIPGENPRVAELLQRQGGGPVPEELDPALWDAAYNGTNGANRRRTVLSHPPLPFPHTHSP